MTNKEAIEWLAPDTSRVKINMAELNGENPVRFINEAIEVAIKALEYKELYRWRTIDTDGFPDENGKYMVHAVHFYAPNDGYEYYGVNNFHDGEFRDLGNLLTPVAWKLIEPHEMENKHDNR